ncbi:tripartite tricarboxylate transporter substrate binding protein [Cupriavidus basilensis]|uniref:Tripartite tricarboxylate transporter substrate binding protein n=1 Tax=Cupriavidus basilensis TaxID=68895 RepID=A0ABT6AVP6_9BURK|nr:tripartite tricarboxylate transporter substrate binding protein [Cupriavidus basilensis]MDF3836704.1 tripartite tricarboxylate transporter substrate binding protein [Cupriavidus basilensis]
MKAKTIGTLYAAITVLGLGASSASAENYPSRPIRLLVPFAAGGPTDYLSRLYAKALSEQLKQTVVVDNKPGAAGNLGVDLVAKAPPDGYTLGFATNGPLAVNVSLFGKLPYDPRKDLTPITRFAFVPSVLVVNPALGIRDLDALIRLFKANPDKYSISSGGNGTTQHLSVEMLRSAAQVKISHVPYKGEGPAMVDVLGNQVPITFASLATGLQQIRAGKVVPLAVTSAQRSPALPNVPTIAEKGYPGFEATAWYGVIAPPGMAPELVQKLNKASVAAINSPEVSQKVRENGGTPSTTSSEEFGAFIRSEVTRWSPIIKASGAKVD